MQYANQDLLLQACRTLFGREVVLSQNFLAYLQPAGARNAYRAQAKAHHPDRFSSAPCHVQQQQAERFRNIHQAYALIKDFLDRRQTGRAATPPKATARAPRPCRTANRRPRPATPTSPYRSQAPIPNIPLEYGMFLFYAGKIAYNDLVRGLGWQRKQRPSIGSLAMTWGWLTKQQVDTILQHNGPSRRFGRKAVELNQLQPQQVDALLAHQRSRQKPLGRYFVATGLLSQREADELARLHRQHNDRLRRQRA